jgi:hypothetical protein
MDKLNWLPDSEPYEMSDLIKVARQAIESVFEIDLSDPPDNFDWLGPDYLDSLIHTFTSEKVSDKFLKTEREKGRDILHHLLASILRMGMDQGVREFKQTRFYKQLEGKDE